MDYTNLDGNEKSDYGERKEAEYGRVLARPADTNILYILLELQWRRRDIQLVNRTR